MQIIIPFAQVEAINPNLRANNLSDSVSQYFRCIAVAAQSFRLNNPEINIKVITNRRIPFEFESIFLKLGVEVEIRTYGFNPPPQFGNSFRGCFYLFDALMHLDQDSLIIDPDVVCVKNLDPIKGNFGKKIAVFYPEFEVDKMINGLSPTTASEIYQEYKLETPKKTPEHIGGEVIYVPKELGVQLLEMIHDLWEWNSNRAINGLSYLTTEEHFLSVLLRDQDIDSLSNIVSRIWTTKTYRAIEGKNKDIDSLYLWHLPSEKIKGFQKIFALSFDREQTKFQDKSFYKKNMHLQNGFVKSIIQYLLMALRR